MASDWKSRAIKVSDGSTSDWKSRAIPVEMPKEYSFTDQVMHPDVSSWNRFVAKNFAQNTDKQVEFLKSKYPNMDIDVTKNGQIRMKNQGEKNWKVLDPDTGFFSKDFLGDLRDVGFDLYAAGSEGLASAAAALGAGAASGGVGAIPAAMAAGGASTAANEAMRQKFGQYLGIPQDVSGEDVAISGAIGSVAPGLLGAGKARGALGLAADKVGEGLSKINPLPLIGEKVSGVPREVLRNYADDGVRANVEKLEKEGITDFSGNVYDKLKNYVETRKDQAGSELVDAIESAGQLADVSGAKQSYLSKIKQLENMSDPTKADKAKLNKLKSDYTKYFGLAKPKEILEKSDDVLARESGLFNQLDEAIAMPVEPPLAGGEVVETLAQKLKTLPPEPSPTYQPEIDSFLSDVYSKVNIPKKEAIFSDMNTTKNIFEELAEAQKMSAGEQKEQTIKSILDEIKQINTPTYQKYVDDQLPARRAWDLQKDLKQVAKFEQGMTPADVYAKGTSRDAYFKLNKALDDASEGLSSKAKSQYKAALQEEAELLPKFEGKTRADSIQKTYNQMSGLDTQGRKVLQEKLGKLSDKEILDLTDEAKILSTYKWLAKPNVAPVSSGGTTSTSRTIPLAIAGGSLGSLAGYNTGGGYAGATLGGATGATLGTLMGSPAAMKAYIRAMRAAGRSSELVSKDDTPYSIMLRGGSTEFMDRPE